MALTSENKDLDAKAHEAQAQQNRSELTRMEWEHEKEVLERHATQLNEELTSKAATLQSLRQRTSAEVCHGSLVTVTVLSSTLVCP